MDSKSCQIGNLDIFNQIRSYFKLDKIQFKLSGQEITLEQLILCFLSHHIQARKLYSINISTVYVLLITVNKNLLKVIYSHNTAPIDIPILLNCIKLIILRISLNNIISFLHKHPLHGKVYFKQVLTVFIGKTNSINYRSSKT